MRDVLPLFPDRFFDLAIADPPYGIGETDKKNSSRGNIAAVTDYQGLSWDLEAWDGSHFERLLVASRNQIVWGGNYYTQFLKPSPCWIVWDKDNGSNDFADCELAWGAFNSAVRKFKYRWNGMLQEPGRPKEPRMYLTQKPKALYRWLLTKYAKPNQVILDPCFGSGGSLRAAKELGFKAYGIDINEQACEIAAKRLSQEVFNFEVA